MIEKRLGRIHIGEEELSKLLGYEGGRVRFIGYMPECGELGIMIEHPRMPLVGDNYQIAQVDRGDV